MLFSPMSLSRRLILSGALVLAALALWLAADGLGRMLAFPKAGAAAPSLLAQRYTDYLFQKPIGSAYLEKRVAMSHQRDPDFAESSFALRLEGHLWVWLPGWHGLAVESDDDGRVFVDGRFVLDNSGVHAPRRRETRLWLGVGRHLLEVEYAQRGGGASLGLSWRPPGRGWAPLPSGRLRPVARPFTMEQAQAWRDRLDRFLDPLEGLVGLGAAVGLAGLWLPLGAWLGALRRSWTRLDFYLLLMVLGAFVLGGAQAWYNPRPGFTPTVRVYERAPFLWQYDVDSYMNFHTAAHFPQVYAEHPIRMNRPLFFGLARLLAEGCYLAARPLVKLTPYQAAFWGFALLKLMIGLVWAMALARLLRPYLEPAAILLAVGLILAQRFTLMSLATWHTYELQFVTATFIALMVLRLAQRYSHARNLGFSLLVGLLMLGKQNYGPYLGALLFALSWGRWKESALSVAAHLVPLGVWMGVLYLMGLTYYNHEAATAGMGTWILRDFLGQGWWKMLEILRNYWTMYLRCFSAWAIPAGMGLVWLYLRSSGQRPGRAEGWFIFWAVAGNFAQYFISGKHFAGYLTSDLWPFIFGAAAAGIMAWPRMAWPRRAPWAAALVVAGTLIFSLLEWINLPWVHPLAQVR